MAPEIDRSALNPVQQRVLDQLLAVGQPRPPGTAELARRCRELVTDGTRRAADLVPDGEGGVYLGKARLDALGCEGRFVDLQDQPAGWSPALVRGTLAHTGIEIDTAGARSRPPADVLDRAWTRLLDTDRAAASLAAMDPVDVDVLRAEALRTVVEFRDQFPLLPSAWHPRTEPALRVRLHGGRVVLAGRPDLVIGRPTLDHRRMLVLDLKTGNRHPDRHRADLALYALLVTLKYGVAPFRVATYYLDEGDWDHRDVDAALLEETARDVAAKAERAARLAFRRPPEGNLRLVAGPACGWCSRAASCPATGARDDEEAAAAPRTVRAA